ncbi:putative [pyruvate dehydrogenase (acetyl-transferring)] kinase, mitochondrial [Trichinella nativa]|uniref:Protein-serine/threonine kinase n=2 Tax=Trichinella TaxID=6333 RepID=A0A0V1LNA5_9BILA|nr:putative [pyruvate dehydrogenase (acetyl-transferring)] kinase, mitochondrial [Trichinella murrelli]KRZ60957.1 putative [pyruvate dehydrogenase (acetyl-transferring)] kinase, mitochondrial [Trichinella nativa]KRZ97837.1 putative [pyruvate dehydrogenase (acetyl-transferring)] kinase, mitochondrial [Trichinella sp. T8]
MQFTRYLFSPLIRIIGRKIDDYAQFRPSALSMQSLVDFGKLRDERNSFEFLKKELLVRLANIMKEVELLPSQLMETPSTKLVYQWYQESFQELLQYENANADESTLRDFSRQLSRVLKRHNTVVETMAEGLMEMKATHGIDPVTQNNIQYFLNRFYLSRISVRMLIYQHVIIFSDEAHPFYTSSRHIGCIDPNCNVVSIIEALDAYENAKFLCDRYYVTSPGIKIETINVLEPSQPISIVYVPSHLYHIMVELLKNALRAVVEEHGKKDELPPITIRVVKGREDLSIKGSLRCCRNFQISIFNYKSGLLTVSDQGGGVPRHIVGKLFNYMYTTASLPSVENVEYDAPMAGLGYGLPLSRLYARYFLGDLFLFSMEGYGTDACLYLKASAVDASEMLPWFSFRSKKMYESNEKGPDWSG